MQLFRKFIGKFPAALIMLLVFLHIYPASADAAEKKKFVVVIDAGHGGNDHGAIENGVNEKDINLAVALKLGEMISKKLKDTEVIYTRDNDTFISLQKRADIANAAKADLFISLHCNSVDRSNKNRSNVMGVSTYVLGRHKDADNLAVARRENSVVELDANDKAHYSQFDATSDESHIIFEMTQKKNLQNSVRFAQDVQKEMVAAGRYSRGVLQAGFWVLWSTAMPAALVEMDFICNPEQAKFLDSKEGQEKIAGAIFNAVKKYESYYRKSTGHASADTPAEEYDDPVAALYAKAEADKAAAMFSDDDDDVSTSFVAEATEMAELPSSASPAAERRHRTEQASAGANRKPTTSHRRRSNRARNAGEVEETVIAVSDEPGSEISVREEEPVLMASTQTASPKNDKKAQKEAKKQKPARRDKSKSTKRKAVKGNVSIVYKVLLFSSDDELKAGDEAFRGLTDVTSFRENNKYNYTYGESEDRKDMETLLNDIESLFPEARIIKRYL